MIHIGVSVCNDLVWENVQYALEDNRLGTGKYIKEFEKEVAKFIGVKHAIAVSSGSMADIVALAVLKNLHPKKTEVIVPALTFIAQTNAVIFNGLRPIFVDVCEDLQINVDEVKKKINKNTLAIMPAHLLGKQANINGLKAIAGKIPILEDCCEGFGIKPDQLGTCSFYPSHTITTGEGGMIVTDNDKYAETSRKLVNHGRVSDKITEKFKFDMIGFNGKMSNLTAAVGCGVIDDAKGVIKQRQKNVEILNKELGKKWFAESPHAYPLMIKDRDKALNKLEKEGIECRRIFSSLPTQEKAYEYMGYSLGDFPVAEKIGNTGMYCPVHQQLSAQDIKVLCQNLKQL